MLLIVLSGLAGTGKSAVAGMLARQRNAIHLSIDTVEDAILGAGLAPGWTTGVAAYEAVRAAAEQNLTLGHTVIVDAVNDSTPARRTWHNAAEATGAELRFVLLLPPPVDEHRRRIERRTRSLANLPEPTWDEVCERARTYEPWDGCPVVDSSQPLDVVVAQVAAAVDAPIDSAWEA